MLRSPTPTLPEAAIYPFDVILFDVGGVLLTNGWDRRERASVLAQFGLDFNDFEARHPVPNDAWERDAISVREYMDATVFYEPRSFTPDAFLAAVCAQSQLLPGGALGILRELAASDNCMLGVLNNEARATNEYRFAQFGLNAFIKVAFSSCYLGMRKPEPAIYRRVLDILGRPADRILFIDDRETNAQAAADAGLRTIVFTGETALRQSLKEWRVL